MAKIRVSSIEQTRREELKATLRSYRARVAEHKACKELYEEMLPSCTQHLSDMPVAPSDCYEPERYAIKRIDQKERMAKSLDDMSDALNETETLVLKVRGEARAILTKHYLLGYSWEEVANELSYSERHVRRLHEKAIDKLLTELDTDTSTSEEHVRQCPCLSHETC